MRPDKIRLHTTPAGKEFGRILKGNSIMLTVTSKAEPITPLDIVTINGTGSGEIIVLDGVGREYFRARASAGLRVPVSGALGRHTALLLDSSGKLVDSAGFEVSCRTAIKDEGGAFGDMLEKLWFDMATNACNGRVKLGKKVYKYFVHWLRDHTHTLKGMKYFDNDLKTGLELYADYQRKDGMIWDLVGDAHPFQMWREHTFAKGNFFFKFDNGTKYFERIPMENDVEFLFLECLYYTWKATSDDKWMARYLDNAIKAVKYSTSNKYRWSKKFKLLKRVYTIDTWDFVSKYDNLGIGMSNVCIPGKSVFGVMHGDNTGMARSCEYLAEMLKAAGRGKEAARFAKLSTDLRKRLDKIAWNGEFYTHHVSEDPSFKRDFGVDESRQVSLSNAYATNRNIRHDQAVAIIKTYQRIRRELPAGSPGEWYNIYPPFEKGFTGGLHDKWNYMNGGVSTIVAGELAHGAFEHGYEDYGADILKRLHAIAEAHGGHMDVCFRGAKDPEPKRSFSMLNLRDLANVDLCGTGAPGVPGWSGDGANDLSQMPTGKQKFLGIPFDVIDPASNGRKACIGISSIEGYAKQTSIRVGAKAKSFYLLHTVAGGGFQGWMTIHYADGASDLTYINTGRQVGSWFMPGATPTHQAGHAIGYPKGWPAYQIAWRGRNAIFKNIGVYVYGHDNPRPDVAIDRIEFVASQEKTKYFILGVTTSDAPVYFPQTDLSSGIPDNWGAAAIVYAVIEGLAGVKDIGRGFDRALLAPRWPAAGIKKATATVKYEACGGYVKYEYAHDPKKKKITMRVSASGDKLNVEVLLPADKSAKAVKIDNEVAKFNLKTVENSRYVCFEISGLAASSVEIALK